MDKKITELTEATSATTDDLLVMVDSPSSGAETKKITVENLLDLIYPVGAVYISVSSTSPATLFGGTWSAFGAGKTLVGIDSGNTAFDTVEETGGVETVTLTAAQSGVPAHNHPISYLGTGGANNWVGANASFSTGNYTSNNAAANASEAHTNLQPYIVTYMFKRTA